MAKTCLIWLLAVSVGAASAVLGMNQCSHQVQNDLFVAKNRQLRKISFSESTANSPIVCGRDCHASPECASFNYHTHSHLCTLNNATRAEYPEMFVEEQGCLYFDTLTDTPLFSVQDRYACKWLQQLGQRESGTYLIKPLGFSDGLQVYCDMETDGGGWLVFQRRQDGSVNFQRGWADYQTGFGDPSGEFWLGNDNLRALTGSVGKWELRVDLEDWEGNTAWAKYGEFKMSGDLYTLHVDLYGDASTAGDSLLFFSGYPFSTWDRDHDSSPDENCAQRYEGAWWFEQCFRAHLNGRYNPTSTVPSVAMGIIWGTWKENYYSLKACTMKIREL